MKHDGTPLQGVPADAKEARELRASFGVPPLADAELRRAAERKALAGMPPANVPAPYAQTGPGAAAGTDDIADRGAEERRQADALEQVKLAKRAQMKNHPLARLDEQIRARGGTGPNTDSRGLV